MRKTLEGVPVSEAFVERLTGRKGLTRAQIRTAVRFAKLASTPGAETYGAGMGAILSGGHTALTESLIDRQLKNADQTLGNKADAPGRCSVISYDLSMRHVESRLTLPPSSARQAFLLSSLLRTDFCANWRPNTTSSPRCAKPGAWASYADDADLLLNR